MTEYNKKFYDVNCKLILDGTHSYREAFGQKLVVGKDGYNVAANRPLALGLANQAAEDSEAICESCILSTVCVSYPTVSYSIDGGTVFGALEVHPDK